MSVDRIKILYAIQGTGNGHVSRAKEIIPILRRMAHVDVLLSGRETEKFLDFDIHYKCHGIGFIFGKNGSAAFWPSILKINFIKLINEIYKLPIESYDLVLSDFEPVSAWACRIKGRTCVALSHQAAVIHPESPKPRWMNRFALNFMKFFAPSAYSYGFHFLKYDGNIYTPIIRSDVRNIRTELKEHYTVYLPAYSDKNIIKFLSSFNEKFHVFAKEAEVEYVHENIRVFPLSHQFIRSMAESKGVICGAGFETPAEALYLGKKLLVIPMRAQYEQYCNAAALKKMGVCVLKRLGNGQKKMFNSWLKSNYKTSVEYPNQTQEILSHIVERHGRDKMRFTYDVMKHQ